MTITLDIGETIAARPWAGHLHGSGPDRAFGAGRTRNRIHTPPDPRYAGVTRTVRPRPTSGHQTSEHFRGIK